MKKFIPPKLNFAVLRFFDTLHPYLMKKLYNIHEIILRPEDIDLLRSIKNERLFFFTNHPSTAEPPIAYWVAKVMGSRFHYMAGREVFNWNFGLNRFLLSRAGAFSIVQGGGDRESMKMARSILASPGGKLVLFPEGGPTCGENDNLMPFQAGVAQLGFWGLEDARKIDPDAEILILPAFIKYQIKTGPDIVREYMEKSISEMENKLGLSQGGRNLLRRFLQIGRVLLETKEQEYHVPMASETDFEYRLGRVRHAILDNVAERLGIKLPDGSLDAIHKLRHVIGIIEIIKVKYPFPGLPNLTEEQIEWAVSECAKAYDFIVIKRDYLVSHPSAERFLEWLMRYESVILGKKARATGGEPWPVPIKAHVRCAKPFKISEYYSINKKEKRSAIEKMLLRIRTDMETLLKELMYLTPTIVDADDIGLKVSGS